MLNCIIKTPVKIPNEIPSKKTKCCTIHISALEEVHLIMTKAIQLKLNTTNRNMCRKGIEISAKLLINYQL